MDLVNYIIIVLTHLFAADDIVSSLIIAAAIVVDFILFMYRVLSHEPTSAVCMA